MGLAKLITIVFIALFNSNIWANIEVSGPAHVSTFFRAVQGLWLGEIIVDGKKYEARAHWGKEFADGGEGWYLNTRYNRGSVSVRQDWLSFMSTGGALYLDQYSWDRPVTVIESSEFALVYSFTKESQTVPPLQIESTHSFHLIDSNTLQFSYFQKDSNGNESVLQYTLFRAR